MTSDRASCIGGHFLLGTESDPFWMRVAEDFFRAVGVTPGRVANARGQIVPRTPRASGAMLSRKTWEVFSEMRAEDKLPESLSWLALTSMDFKDGSVFAGADAGTDPACMRQAVIAFLEHELLPRQSRVRYLYYFERPRSLGPQLYVAGIGTFASWQKYEATKDELLEWWGNRLVYGQSCEVVRDVFERNCFLRCAANNFLDDMLAVASSFGVLRDIGDYVVWELAKQEIPAARQRLLAKRLIAPMHWESRGAGAERG